MQEKIVPLVQAIIAMINSREEDVGCARLLKYVIGYFLMSPFCLTVSNNTMFAKLDDMIGFEDDRIENLPEIVIDQKGTSRLMGVILSGLSEEQRLVITMHCFEELSVKEVADILNVSEGTVKSRLNYGRKKIEAGVRELEKKRTKLYSLAPVPFLLLLFRGQEVHAAKVPNPETLQALQKGLLAGLSSSAKKVSYYA